MTWSLSAQYLGGLVLLTATAVALLGWISRRDARWAAALIACQLASLLPLAATYNPVRDASWFYPTPDAIAWLQAHRDGRAVMPGHVGQVYGIALAQGYDGMTPRRIDDIAGPVGAGNAAAAGFRENPLNLWGSEPLTGVGVLTSGVSDLLAVRYLLMTPKAELGWPGLRVVYDAADARIFERAHALPRAFLVGSGRCVADAEAIRLVRTGGVDFRREVLLAECEKAERGAPPTARDGVEILPSAADRVRLTVTTSEARYVVVSDTWFPGWQATVNGHAAKVWRANHAFRAVRVPAGRHDVELWFRPRGFQGGLAVSLAALGSVLVLGLVGVRRGAAKS